MHAMGNLVWLEDVDVAELRAILRDDSFFEIAIS